MIIDKIHLISQAGNGGKGCESYYHRRDKKTVPDGGDGGKGGNVIFRCDTNAPSLASLRFRKKVQAENGGHGRGNKKRGKNGQDEIVLVPEGTRIYDRQNDFLIRELLHPGDEVIVSEGGRGGSGNAGGKSATPGEPGKTFNVELTIRLVADVFILGLPNSGKSKLMNALTRVQAKEESYPFSTQDPNIGVWKYSDYESLTLCEMPSLYRGSHEGRGLGTDFLKHLERAKLVLYMIEPGTQFAETIREGYEILRNEVEIYSKSFLDKPSAIVISKIDLPQVQKQIQKEKFKADCPIFKISVQTGDGLDALKTFMIEKCFSQSPESRS